MCTVVKEFKFDYSIHCKHSYRLKGKREGERPDLEEVLEYGASMEFLREKKNRFHFWMIILSSFACLIVRARAKIF